MKIDYAKATDWFRNKWKGTTACPICQSDQWQIGEELLEIRQFHGGVFSTGGNIYPFIQVICKTCGYTMFFSAVIAGIVKPGIYSKETQ